MVRIFGFAALVLSVLATSVLALPTVNAPGALALRTDINTAVSSSAAPAVNSDASSAEVSKASSTKASRTFVNLGGLRSHSSNILRSISGRISSNWRSNQGEIVVVQNIVKSLILSGLQGGFNNRNNIIDLNDIQLVLSQLNSFGFNNIDVSFIEDVIEQQIFEQDVEEIILEMLEQVLELFDVAGFEGLSRIEHFENSIEIVSF